MRRSERGARAFGSGIMWEELTCNYLESSGFSILKRRFKAGNAEVDIIGQKGGTLVFFEVKFRKDSSELEGIVSKAQLERILRAAEEFLVLNPNLPQEYRIDFIFISKNRELTHMENISF